MHVICFLIMQTVLPIDPAINGLGIRNRLKQENLDFRLSESVVDENGALQFRTRQLSFGKMLWQDTKDVLSTPLQWRSRDWREMGYLVASFAVVNQFDDEVAHFARSHENSALNRTSRELGKFGEEYSFATLASFYLAGKILGDEKPVNVAKDGLIASVIAAGLVTPLIKEAGGRVRPRDQVGGLETGNQFQPFSGNHSFPSGHTTQAFAVASVVAEHYPNPWARGVSYGLASLVGLSRVQDDAHYASDVAAGAAIGFFIGRKVARLNQGKRDRITFDPMVNDGYLGIRVRIPQQRKSLRERLGWD